MYGGTGSYVVLVFSEEGLSPRVRGNQHAIRLCPRKPRSIPACTGEPYSRREGFEPVKVYPRVYGGTIATLTSVSLQYGLSPRVRGNQQQQQAIEAQPRSIPACTGEPAHRVRLCSRVTVYPRVYGGTHFLDDVHSSGGGLSPRVRGNRTCDAEVITVSGSIPACTGEPPRYAPRAEPFQVYPRVYGGTVLPARQTVGYIGLSPRVRGNRNPGRLCRAGCRSIPACTGEPRACRLPRVSQGVYPRVYGGTRPPTPTHIRLTGLSPRVRGNLFGLPLLVAGSRSIPACTGEPPPVRLSVSHPRVYPRVYGGTRAVF